MIIYHLKEIAIANKMNKSDLHYASGVSYPTVSRLWDSDEKIRQIDVTVLSKLCKALNCSVGDLLEYVPDETTVHPAT